MIKTLRHIGMSGENQASVANTGLHILKAG